MTHEIIDKLTTLLRGSIPQGVDLEKLPENRQADRELAVTLNQLIAFMQETHDVIMPLSRGELTELKISHDNFLASPFRELSSRLLHLTWQAKQVANGDFSQRVDFMGDFSEAFNSMIIALDEKEKQLNKKINDLEDAISRINTLEGLLPICARCKQIRKQGSDPKDQNNWVHMETFISERTHARFSHTICPQCQKELYGNYLD